LIKAASAVHSVICTSVTTAHVYVLDDNIRFFKEIDFEHPPESREAFYRGEGPRLVPFSDCLSHVEKQTLDTVLSLDFQKKKFEGNKESKPGHLFSYSGSFSQYAVQGFQKRPRFFVSNRSIVHKSILLYVYC
jgi:hypothetical protein